MTVIEAHRQKARNGASGGDTHVEQGCPGGRIACGDTTLEGAVARSPGAAGALKGTVAEEAAQTLTDARNA